jgi:hypothetical protein
VFDFGGEGKTIRLTATDYLLEVWDSIYEKTKRVSTFQSLSDFGEDGAILLGAPFLNGLHSVFDGDGKSISFGKRG